MSDRCPFCGAKQNGRSHNLTTFGYECGTWWPGGKVDITRECYERQLVAKDELLKEALRYAKSYQWCLRYLAKIADIGETAGMEKLDSFLDRPEIKALEGK